jgi:hypothetical protein
MGQSLPKWALHATSAYPASCNSGGITDIPALRVCAMNGSHGVAR